MPQLFNWPQDLLDEAGGIAELTRDNGPPPSGSRPLGTADSDSTVRLD